MRIYTKYGDTGYTRIVGGKRLMKDDVRVESYGTIDELCSLVGQAMTIVPTDWKMNAELAHIQQIIFSCGSDLAVADFFRPFKVTEAEVEWLELAIDRYLEETTRIEKFVMPGGHPLACQLNLLRSVTRRGERRIVSLIKTTNDVNPFVLQYINRLSDYFFVSARVANQRLEIEEVFYEQSPKIFKSKKRTEP